MSILHRFRLAALLSVGAATALTLTAPSVATAQSRPMVERVVPSSGPPGTRVRIEGRGFRRSYRVLFNERPVTPTEFLSERITVVVPDNATTGRWVLSDGSDEVETEVFRVTAPSPAPVIRALEPSTVSPGAELTIRGENFAPRPTDNAVRVNDRPMVVRSGDGTSLRVIVPDGATTGPVFVRVGGSEARSPVELGVGSRLVIREFTPRAVVPGGRVTIRGTGFATTPTQNRLALNGRALRVLRATETEMEAQLPLQAETGTLTLEVPGGGRYESPLRLFVGAAPVIRALTPAMGPPGTRVTIRGEHFGSDVSRVEVTFGGRPAAVATAAPVELVATVPEGAASGRVAVTVNGIGPIESTTDFTVPAPVTVTGFEPRAGDAGENVTIRGTGFSTTTDQDEVTLNGTRLRVVSATADAIVAEIPQGARSGNLVVRVAGGPRVIAREPFRVTARPRVTAVEPERGVPGSEVTLRGANFPPDRALASVRLNGVEVPIVRYARDAVVVRVPENAQTGRFQVIGRLQGTGVAPTEFFVLQPVTLREVDLPRGPVGSTVTLRGTGFEPDVPASRCASVPASCALAREHHRGGVRGPARRARRGDHPRGRGAAVGDVPQPFRVTLAPVVTAVTPATAAPGARVTIRGRNFGRDAAAVGVMINGVTCPAASVTPTAIVCELPPSATTGPLVVRVAFGGEARAAAPFRVSR
ncbi:MAG: IPT/TIG domain-containing protein [Polyangiales bacterium]